MKQLNFKNSLIALTISLVMVSCGGGNKQSQSEATTPETTQQAVESQSTDNGDKWANNEYTQALAQKPEGTITMAEIQDMGSYKVFAVEVNGTAEQAKTYATALQNAGFKAGEIERPSEVFNGSKGNYKVKVGAYSTGDSWYIQVVKE